MRTIRVYSEDALSPESSAELGAAAAHHVTRVLRMRVGDGLELFDDSGRNFSATITAIGKQRVSVSIGEAQPGTTESNLHSCLWLGVCRGGRMDYLVQKATELGVTAIRPVITERCVVRLNGDRAENRRQHWQKIAVAAAEQSRRVKVPVVSEPRRLEELLAGGITAAATHIILDPEAGRSIGNVVKPGSAVALLTGPEGGFSDTEVSAARAAGFVGVSLGPRILRSDTAPLAALSVAQYLAGDCR